MTPPSVFIIILQYNNSEDTIKCLNSVKELHYPNFRTIVVDNASDKTEQDNIREYVKSQLQDLKRVSLVFNSQNLGYAGGNNIGINYALSEGADYIFILNNDTTVEPDTLDKLVTAAEQDPQVGAVGPAIIEPNKTVYHGKISWLKPELRHSTTKPKNNFLNFKEYLIGAGLLVKRGVLEKIEGLDEIFFLYFEDADFSMRAQLAGYKLQVVPEAVIHHGSSASTKKLGSPLLLRYHMRNALIFNSLNAPWTIKPFLIFWAGYVLLKNLFKMFLLPSKEKSADAIIDGVLDFYKNQFGKINP
ncbi:MAG: glycosyltransferase family 2 protein [bacterium]|nr:glycosyltransferase family 2 protein [bacterium]